MPPYKSKFVIKKDRRHNDWVLYNVRYNGFGVEESTTLCYFPSWEDAMDYTLWTATLRESREYLL